MSTPPRTLLLTAASAVLAVAGCTADPPAAVEARGGDPVPTLSPLVDSAAVLVVEDQKSEGPTVLAMAALTRGGFIVVYGDDGRNELGSGSVDPSTKPEAVQISLAEELTEPTALLARLFEDTDGNGLYSAGDRPVSNGVADDSDDANAFPGEQETFQFTGKKVVNG